MNTEIKEMKWILNTHKNIIDSNYNKEIIIDKLTIVDTDFDIINIRIKELTLYTTSDTNFSELNNLLKYIKFDYLKLYLYKIQSHDLDFLKVRIDEIFLINLALTPKIINLMHKNYFSLFKLHLIECENIKLINSKLLNLTELSLLANTFILPEVAASVRAHRPGIRGAPASYDISSLLREKTKIKK